MEDIILHAGKSSLQIKKTKFRNKISNVCNKKWFDKECRLKRHSVRKLSNQKHRDPLNNDIRNEYHLALKTYKNTLKRKKELFHENKLEELERVSDSFWKVLKNMSDELEDFSFNKPDVTASSWLNHFESLHTKHLIGPEQINILQTLKTLEMEPTNNLLDELISEYEIINAARKLKNNKSAYSDKIRNEMLKYSTNILLQGYKKLFNLILETGSFPDQWCEAVA